MRGSTVSGQCDGLREISDSAPCRRREGRRDVEGVGV